MEFYLKYDGPLKSNAGPKDKHGIREYFYPQMKKLWDTEQSGLSKSEFLSELGALSVLREIDGITFAPLVCSKLKLVCQLDITILWPEEPGVISQSGGDIDNRLKTLFDALQCPDSNQIKAVRERFTDKEPFYCLLENDKLITSVNIKTHTLLLTGNRHHVSVLIHIAVKATELMWGTIGFAG